MKQKKGKIKLPQKTSINLVIKEQTINSPSRIIPLFLITVALVATFCKFGVVDRLAQVDVAQARLDAVLTEQRGLQRATADFDTVLTEYSHYTVNWMDDTEKAQVDRLQILELIDSKLASGAQVEQFAATGNILSVSLSGVTLEQTSYIVQNLEQSPIVSGVSVYTAVTNEGKAESVATPAPPVAGETPVTPQTGEAQVESGMGSVVLITMTITLQQAAEGGEDQ